MKYFKKLFANLNNQESKHVFIWKMVFMVVDIWKSYFQKYWEVALKLMSFWVFKNLKIEKEELESENWKNKKIRNPNLKIKSGVSKMEIQNSNLKVKIWHYFIFHVWKLKNKFFKIPNRPNSTLMF